MLVVSRPVVPHTSDRDYALRLRRSEDAWWKRLLDVQAPYRRHLRRLQLGSTLEVGCGVGRNLRHLAGDAVGVDASAHAVELARERGCVAYTRDEFRSSPRARPASFDSLLFAHVLEHMSLPEAIELVREYRVYLRPRGRVVLIAPQEAGFRADPTHVEWMDFDRLHAILAANRVEPLRSYSFPFPRPLGRVFPHNEFVVVGVAAVG